MNLAKIFPFLRKKEVTASDIASQGWIPLTAIKDDGNRYGGIVFACVNKNAEAFSSVDFFMEQKDKKGEFHEIQDHPFLEIIDDPHDDITWLDMLKMVGGHYEMDGEIFFIIRRAMNNRPYQLFPVNPKTVAVNTDESGLIKNYSVMGITYPKEDILPIHNFNPHSVYRGVGKIQAAMMTLDSVTQAKLWNAAMYRNFAAPAGVLSFPKDTTIDQKTQDSIRDYFQKKQSGAENAGKLLVTTGGATYAQLSITPKELDYLKSINADEDFIQHKIFGVPAEVFGKSDASTYANGVTAVQMWEKYTLEPIARTFCNQITEWLLPQFGIKNVRLNYRPIVTENREIQLNETTKLYDSGLITLNEGRQRYALPPLDRGDQLKTENETPQTEPQEDKKVEPEKKAIGKQYNHQWMGEQSDATFQATRKQYLSEVESAYLKCAEAAIEQFKAIDSTPSEKYWEIIYPLVIAISTYAFINGGKREAEYLGIDESQIDWENPFVIGVIASVANLNTNQVVTTIERNIDKWIRDIDPSEAVEAITRNMREIADYSSQRLVDTVTSIAFGRGREHSVAISNQVLAKAWRVSVVSPDICPLCTENEEYGWIPYHDSFPNGDVPAHPNCYCYQVEEPMEWHR